ncbi:MAG: hypothetical protein HQL49_01775 [Gammaproteobacteria bacterium]|nr:hypothetical protein [Gammaproteobacteria bacterium]
MSAITLPETQSDTGRGSFAIKETIFLEISPYIEGDETTHKESNIDAELDTMNELHQQSQYILTSLRKTQPDLCSYLTLFERKVQILTHLFESMRLGETAKPNQMVTISTSGLIYQNAMSLGQYATAGGKVALRMVFFPSLLSIHCDAEVVSSKPFSNHEGVTHYQHELRFCQISEVNEDRLVRHMLETQSRQLRQQREERQQR